MKKPLHQFMSVFLTCLITIQAKAQTEFRSAVSNNATIKINEIIGDITIKGYAGNEIIIQPESFSIPKTAEGLKLVTGFGSDNTGVGINVQEVDGTIAIQSVRRKETDYTIQVPEKVKLHITASSNRSGDISIEDFKGELEIKTRYNDLDIKNVSGPIVLNATYGEVNIVFSEVNQDKPISLIAAYDDIDITLPANTKANIEMESTYGDIYTDFDIKRENEANGMSKVNNNPIIGTINGGGVKIYVKSPYENVFLRKQK